MTRGVLSDNYQQQSWIGEGIRSLERSWGRSADEAGQGEGETSVHTLRLFVILEMVLTVTTRPRNRTRRGIGASR